MNLAKKILVGEDSSIIINLTKNILAFEKYEMKAAKNGVKVLESLEKENFDLILMDISMPKMDGVECTQRIRKMTDPVKSQIPIIAISGNVKNYTLEEFKNMGFNDFLQKPLNYDLLLATVKKTLQ